MSLGRLTPCLTPHFRLAWQSVALGRRGIVVFSIDAAEIAGRERQFYKRLHRRPSPLDSLARMQVGELSTRQGGGAVGDELDLGRSLFGDVDLGDERRRTRLFQLTEAIVRQPAGTLPIKLHSRR